MPINFTKAIKNFYKKYFTPKKKIKNQNQNQNQDGDFANIGTIQEIGNQTPATRTQRTSRGTSTGTSRGTSRGTSTGTSRGTPRTPRPPTATPRTPRPPTATPRTPTATPRPPRTPRPPTATPKPERTPVLSRKRMFVHEANRQNILKKAKPQYLTKMQDDAFGIVIEQMFNELPSIVFNNVFLENLKSKEVLIADLLKKRRDLPRIETYLLQKIEVIDLQDITLNKYIIEVLDMTVTYSKVSTIILRNITFENIDDIDNFLAYLGKNTQIDTLILRNVKLIKESSRTGVMKYLIKFISTIGMLNNIKYLEFSNFDIINEFEIVDINNSDSYFAFHFIRLLIKLEKLKYLIFNNNNIDDYDYYDIFRESYVIDENLTDDKDVIKENNKMLYVIKNYFPSTGRKRLHIVSVKYNKPVKEIDTELATECINRRANDFYATGNKDSSNDKPITEYKNFFVMNQMKIKKEELLDKYKIRLTLTNNSSENGSRSGRSSGSTNQVLQTAILNSIVNNSRSTPIRNSS
jgi:hypothetical protein